MPSPFLSLPLSGFAYALSFPSKQATFMLWPSLSLSFPSLSFPSFPSFSLSAQPAMTTDNIEPEVSDFVCSSIPCHFVSSPLPTPLPPSSSPPFPVPLPVPLPFPSFFPFPYFFSLPPIHFIPFISSFFFFHLTLDFLPLVLVAGRWT